MIKQSAQESGCAPEQLQCNLESLDTMVGPAARSCAVTQGRRHRSTTVQCSQMSKCCARVDVGALHSPRSSILPACKAAPLAGVPQHHALHE
jgi:hypothetical protein